MATLKSALRAKFDQRIASSFVEPRFERFSAGSLKGPQQ
jgi:hypothetical protein